MCSTLKEFSLLLLSNFNKLKERLADCKRILKCSFPFLSSEEFSPMWRVCGVFPRIFQICRSKLMLGSRLVCVHTKLGRTGLRTQSMHPQRTLQNSTQTGVLNLSTAQTNGGEIFEKLHNRNGKGRKMCIGDPFEICGWDRTG